MRNENLLSYRLSEEEVENKLIHNSMFNYNISEGGFVSYDNLIIVFTCRCPYNGQVFSYMRDLTNEEKEYWQKVLNEIFKP